MAVNESFIGVPKRIILAIMIKGEISVIIKNV